LAAAHEFHFAFIFNFALCARQKMWKNGIGLNSTGLLTSTWPKTLLEKSTPPAKSRKENREKRQRK